MKVYQRLAQAFKAEGTSAVFGIMGDANMYWYSELDKLGVQLVEVRHEGAGLGMADGWARATHTPGVASATCGPGTSQLATGLRRRRARRIAARRVLRRASDERRRLQPAIRTRAASRKRAKPLSCG